MELGLKSDMQKRDTIRKRAMYLAPLDAIWPPLALIAFASTVGLVSAWFGIKSLAFLAIVGIAILIGDTFGRSKDYLNARRRFINARNDAETLEVVRRFRRAWCARVACNAAWKRVQNQADYDQKLTGNYVNDVYYELGYRRWHIFPDGTFTKHSPFLKLAFWIHLFTGKMKRDRIETPEPSLSNAVQNTEKPAMEPAE